MTYFVNVRDKQHKVRHVEESILDGIIPQHVIDLMLDRVVDEDLQLCRICDVQGRRCHVMVWIKPHTYAKYCPILWHDIFKPRSWTVADLA